MIPVSQRKWVRHAIHLGALAWALALPWSPPWAILGFLLLAILGNLFLPHWLPWVLPHERAGQGHLEASHYPAALLMAFLAFARPHGEAVGLAIGQDALGTSPWYAWPLFAWMVLALGDPLLGVAQRLSLQGPTLPWNRRKRLWPWIWTTLGLIPTLAWAASSWLGLPVFACALAVALGLLAETLWFGIDDNWLMPFTVCAVGALLPVTILGREAGSLLWVLPPLFGIAAWALKKLTLGGAGMGMLCGYWLLAAHPALFALLCGFFALGVAATAFGFAGKQKRGLAEARGGRRGAAEVFGAAGIAAWTSTLAILLRHSGATDTEVLQACLLPGAALAAKAMDTVSSEVGKARRGRTWLIPECREVPPGSEGAWSREGTAAGLVAAFLLASLGWGLGLASPLQGCAWVGIALLANGIESLWARFWHRRGIDPGAHTNVILTASAALLAWWLWVQ